MLSAKRVVIATLCGLVCGLICLTLASSNPDPTASMSTGLKLSIVFGRTLLGFTIGISALRMKWWLHGIVLGIITSFPMAFPILDQMSIFVGTFVMGVIYGLLIELVTSVLFKAKSAFQ